MPRLDTKKCCICEKMINMLGAYAQLSLTKHAHLVCYAENQFARGKEAGRSELLQEQEAVKQHEVEMAETKMRTSFDDLPRCITCGKRVNEAKSKYFKAYPIEDMRKFGEVVEPSTGALGKPGVCKNCVEVERIAQNQARGKPRPQETPEPAKTEDKPKEKTRFELLDID